MKIMIYFFSMIYCTLNLGYITIPCDSVSMMSWKYEQANFTSNLNQKLDSNEVKTYLLALVHSTSGIDKPFNDMINDYSKLESKESIKLAVHYREVISQHLQALVDVDQIALDLIIKILSSTESYENVRTPEAATQLKKSIQSIVELANKTATLPHSRVMTLSDLLDESKVNLYPLFSLKVDVRDTLEEIGSVVLGIHQASDQYVSSFLCNLYLILGVEPTKGRTDINFQQLAL